VGDGLSGGGETLRGGGLSLDTLRFTMLFRMDIALEVTFSVLGEVRVFALTLPLATAPALELPLAPAVVLMLIFGAARNT
jgi:hypothetical protein